MPAAVACSLARWPLRVNARTSAVPSILSMKTTLSPSRIARSTLSPVERHQIGHDPPRLVTDIDGVEDPRPQFEQRHPEAVPVRQRVVMEPADPLERLRQAPPGAPIDVHRGGQLGGAHPPLVGDELERRPDPVDAGARVVARRATGARGVAWPVYHRRSVAPAAT